jgi:TolB-like protein/DNA-binding winged helix-turn-helix (wHTH) protein/predicted Zn-dependent protease
MTPAGRTLGFSDVTLDLDGGRLLRGDQEIALRPKSFAVLAYLVARAGRLVTRDELLSAVWADTVVIDDSLTQCIGDIRRALGGNGEQIIRTVPRRGYLFSVPVTESADAGGDARGLGDSGNGGDVPDRPAASAPVPSRYAWPSRHVVAGVALVLVAAVAWWITREAPAPEETVAPQAPPNSIAVLRFADMSEGGDQTYLADGLAEEILHALAQSPELLVIARTSSFAISGDDIATVAAKLKVAHVLEGSVRRSGDRIRVTAQLVDAATSVHQWSQTYERELDDLFGVQTEIASAVANALEVTLAGGTDRTHAAPGDARAYELYLRAHFFYNRRGPGDIDRARELYERALAIDPEFARPWVGLAAIYNELRMSQRVPLAVIEPESGSDATRYRELTESERQAVEEALRLAPSLPEAHMRAARYYWLNGDRENAIEHRERARTLDPDHPLVLGSVANAHLWGNRLDAAIAVGRRAVLHDPLGAVFRENLADFLLMANRPEEAIAEYRNVLELGPALSGGAGRVDLPVFGVGRALLLQGRLDDALDWIEPWPAGVDRDYALAILYRALKRTAAADAALQRLLAGAQTSDPLRIAEVYAYRGDFDAALAWLNRIGSLDGCRSNALMFAFYSPFLALMHAEPRWQAWRSETGDVMQACDSVGSSPPGEM